MQAFSRATVLGVVAACSLAAAAGAQQVWYVDHEATGQNTGRSWQDAFVELQSALAAAQAGDEVWVVAGVYRPHTSDRTASFRLKSGVAVYGGFDGTERTLEERAGLFDRTILSGDLAGNDQPPFLNYAENSFHVVTGHGADATALLDGFTIRAGNASGASTEAYGGGLYVEDGDPVLSNCTLTANSANEIGGGAFCHLSDVVLTHCAFVGNRVTGGHGGGFYTFDGSPSLSHCTFTANAAPLGGGGGMRSYTSDTRLFDGLFVDNTAQFGAGLAVRSNQPQVTNCTFAGNVASDRGGGVFVAQPDAQPAFLHCILWNNRDAGGADESAQLHADDRVPPVDIQYSCVMGCGVYCADPNRRNFGDDPLFVRGLLGDHYLSQTAAGQERDSPALDAGRDLARDLGLDTRTTRTDDAGDAGVVDLGFHFPVAEADFCDLVRNLSGDCLQRCSDGRLDLEGRIKSDLPPGFELIVTLDGGDERSVKVKRSGKASFRWQDVARRPHEVCLAGCPDRCIQVTCCGR